ncbi:MAG: flagellar motor switch protein FliM [Liquorilactobacillus ghanensis]|uniref:flagellar motor switch protein FliM n=1 Tax=Liquorilactobacillus ghanensis TaxID=399370 RepID=UPI0039ED79F8
MDQVLSQQEIDKLLAAMNNGEIDQEKIEEEEKAPKVKPYDFRRPIKLSKEYVNTLHMIFEDFSKMSTNILSNLLRVNVTLQLASIEKISFDEFIHSIPRVTLIGLFHSALADETPMKGIQMVEINPQLCMRLVELLCGGTEVEPPKETTNNGVVDDKSFTDIELAILREVLKELGIVFQNSWKDIVQMETELDDLDTNPQLLQTMSPNEPVVLTTFTMQIGDMSTFLNICIPYVFFEGISDKLSFKNWFDSSQKLSKDDERELERGLNNVGVSLEARLGSAQMEMADFLHLEVGDVIKLDRKTSAPLDTYVNGIPFYQAKPGKRDGNLAVELLDKLEGDPEDE